MSQADCKTAIRPGSRLGIHVPGESASDFSGQQVLVDSVDGERIWIKGSCAGLTPGDEVLLEQPVPGDARYVQLAEIEVVAPDRFALRPLAEPERLQQRAFVRVATEGLHLRISRPERANSPAPARRLRAGDAAEATDHYAMLDLSAGGVRFHGDPSFGLGETIVCHFELPGVSCFALPGRVQNLSSAPPAASATAAGGAAAGVGIQFLDLDEEHRSALLSWVFYEQVRQHLLARRKAGQPLD